MIGGLRDHPGFRRFWLATTVSTFGTYVTTLAVGVLLVEDLGASTTAIGWVNAARWAPYLLVGLLAGVLADRVRRRPLLVATDLGRAVLLAAVPVAAGTGALTVGLLGTLLAGVGLLSVGNDAAHQSFLPRLLPVSALPRANTRLEQSASVAQTTGPLVGSGLVALLGAPLTLLVDAVSYLVSGLLVLGLPIDDPRPARSPRGVAAIGCELREGVHWVYRHPTLRPMALSGHAWFVFNGIVGTVYVPYALRELGIGVGGVGLTAALAGVGAVVGSAISARVVRRLGIAGCVTGSQLAEGLGFALIAAAPGGGTLASLAVAALGQGFFGLGLGVENPVELSYRQAVTPDALQGRMNSTMRSLNRAALVVGAPAGGLLAAATSSRWALLVGATGFVVGAVALRMSRFRSASY